MGLLSSGHIQSPLELITSDNVLGCACGESLRYSHLKIKLLENDIRLTRKQSLYKPVILGWSGAVKLRRRCSVTSDPFSDLLSEMSNR